jgi:hypothetical protein
MSAASAQTYTVETIAHTHPARPIESLTFVLAGLARVAETCGLLRSENYDATDGTPRLPLEASTYLVQAMESISDTDILPQFFEYLKHPQPNDGSLVSVSRQFQLSMIEALAVRLAMAAEHDMIVGQVLARLHSPRVCSRPTLGLLAKAFGAGLVAISGSDISSENNGSIAIEVLAHGEAMRCGLLELLDIAAPLLERQVRVPLHTCANLSAIPTDCGTWPGTTLLHLNRPIPLGRAADEQADILVQRLQGAAEPAPVLIVRSGDVAEARAAAERVANGCGQRALLLPQEGSERIAPWLSLSEHMPVFLEWLSPGERKIVPVIPAYSGPLLVIAGPDGEFTSNERIVLEWRLGVPSVEERCMLWHRALGNEELAGRLAREYRHTAGRVAALAAKAKERAEIRALRGSVSSNQVQGVSYGDVRAVSRSGEGVGLAALAELVRDEVADEALVVPAALRLELQALVERCRLRDAISDGLGPSMQARYRSSVRVLLVGPSGTGKTLAASWLATQLGLPLFRVDLSAITSKYIGETEKNLSQLLTLAERSEVVLLFDEADSLFAKRTEVREANDRFANSQTNYLLQRMESYDGITVLTSNSRARFDAAFARRLDVILEFPLPGPEERRGLWLAHLGARHRLSAAQLNGVAANADLSGGQIRNVVLSAAIAARGADPITYSHLVVGLASEYRKLARQLPDQLRQLVET